MAITAVILVFLIIGGGCLGEQGGEPTTTAEAYTVEGEILDARSGDGLSDVTIIVDDRTTETDASGEFLLTAVPRGEYTLTAEKTGYLSTEITVRLTADRRVSLTLRNEEFYDPDQSPLLQTHWEQDLTCTSCHGRSEDIQSPPPDSTCTECHPLASIRNDTAEFTPNPHADPHGRARDCGSCHRVHEPSVNGCTGCHSDTIIPTPP